jgi:hypothetical protein
VLGSDGIFMPSFFLDGWLRSGSNYLRKAIFHMPRRSPGENPLALSCGYKESIVVSKSVGMVAGFPWQEAQMG